VSAEAEVAAAAKETEATAQRVAHVEDARQAYAAAARMKTLEQGQVRKDRVVSDAEGVKTTGGQESVMFELGKSMNATTGQFGDAHVEANAHVKKLVGVGTLEQGRSPNDCAVSAEAEVAAAAKETEAVERGSHTLRKNARGKPRQRGWKRWSKGKCGKIVSCWMRKESVMFESGKSANATTGQFVDAHVEANAHVKKLAGVDTLEQGRAPTDCAVSAEAEAAAAAKEKDVVAHWVALVAEAVEVAAAARGKTAWAVPVTEGRPAQVNAAGVETLEQELVSAACVEADAELVHAVTRSIGGESVEAIAHTKVVSDLGSLKYELTSARKGGRRKKRRAKSKRTRTRTNTNPYDTKTNAAG